MGFENKLLEMQVPPERIRLQTNYYLEDMRDRIFASAKEMDFSQEGPGLRVLYVCENISSCEAVYPIKEGVVRGYDEFEALRLFLKKLRAGFIADKFQLRIRPHPSETFHKYESITNEFSELPISFSKSGEKLERDLAWSEVVVGCESMAMAAAVEARKRVISCIPSKALVRCRLPYLSIEHI